MERGLKSGIPRCDVVLCSVCHERRAITVPHQSHQWESRLCMGKKEAPQERAVTGSSCSHRSEHLAQENGCHLVVDLVPRPNPVELLEIVQVVQRVDESHRHERAPVVLVMINSNVEPDAQRSVSPRFNSHHFVLICNISRTYAHADCTAIRSLAENLMSSSFKPSDCFSHCAVLTRVVDLWNSCCCV